MPEVDRAAASREAVRKRRARATVKASIASGARTALDVLDTATREPAGIEGSIRVTEYLLSIPSIGVTKLNRILEALEISPVKRLGGLGRLQRDRLREFIVERQPKRRRSRLVVLAGPTAVGKGTVAAYIRDHFPEVHLSVSATTRHPRPGEVEGVNYYFVSDEGFDRLIDQNELLEHATVHNAFRYGTPRAPIDRALAAGDSALLEIDIQGARQVRAAMPEATLVFLLPPSWDELVRRLVGRGTEDEEERERRLRTAKVELAAADEFDYRVVNDDVARAAQEVVDLMKIHGE
ncbi:guanylate kinase [Plantibacter sp. Mn2098]|uniref:guanylate kinase n=1 Tax=Plantibacter sp. Mn2098 TaxID=3395266 RepID=UPI003BC32FA1